LLPGLRRRELAGISLVDGGRLTSDTVGHGTAVATLAAGSGDLGVWGVAPGARVLPIVAGSASVPLNPVAVARGIRLAVGAGASVINLSLGRPSDDAGIRAAIDSAAAAGVIVVAAGGDNSAPGPLFPADIPGEVIAVRALSQKGEPTLYSNGAGLDGLDAPGEDVQAVTVRDEKAMVSSFGGSSAAAALVSGAVALLEACARRTPGSVMTRSAAVRALRVSFGAGPWFNLPRALHFVGC
jgi:subtilisin family serine protease